MYYSARNRIRVENASAERSYQHGIFRDFWERNVDKLYSVHRRALSTLSRLEDLFIAKYSKNSILLQNIRNYFIYSLKKHIYMKQKFNNGFFN